MDVGEIEWGVDWIDLVNYREKCKALANTQINLLP
jgi:hypothetical protein